MLSVRKDHMRIASFCSTPPTGLLIACDLGTDKIMIFRFDARRGKLIPNEDALGTGSSPAPDRAI